MRRAIWSVGTALWISDSLAHVDSECMCVLRTASRTLHGTLFGVGGAPPLSLCALWPGDMPVH